MGFIELLTIGFGICGYLKIFCDRLKLTQREIYLKTEGAGGVKVGRKNDCPR